MGARRGSGKSDPEAGAKGRSTERENRSTSGNVSEDTAEHEARPPQVEFRRPTLCRG